MSRKLATVAAVYLAVSAVGLLAVGASAADPAQHCATSKWKAAGKEMGGKMGCYAKAKQLSTGVDSTCIGKAETKAGVKIDKAGTGCAGTAMDIDAAVDDCVTTFLNDDPNEGDCPAASAKVIGK